MTKTFPLKLEDTLYFLLSRALSSVYLDSASPLQTTALSVFEYLSVDSQCSYGKSFWTIFKTALVSIIFILELSVLNKSCLELNFQANKIISRVPCTTVFLRFHTSGFQY